MVKRNFLHHRGILGSDSFFYTTIHGKFTHASTLKVLIEKNHFKPKPNIAAMSDFIFHAAIGADQTFYEDIYRLPPAHSIAFFNGKVSIARYWDPSEISIDYNLSFEDAKERFGELLKKAVEKAIPGHETVACELSGGFDSSSVYCLAKKNHSNTLAMTMDYTDPSCDERKHVNSVLKKYPGEIIRRDCQNIDYKNQYNMAYNYALTPHWPIWITFTMKAPLLDALMERNITTVLTGQMGDHILYGSRDETLYYYLKKRKIKQFFFEWNHLPHKWQWTKNQIKKSLLSFLSEKQKNTLKKVLKKPIDEEFEIPKKYFTEYSEKNTFDSEFQKSRIHNLTNANFCMYIDSSFSRAAESHGIHFAHPYADPELVRFMLTVPPYHLYSMGNPRHLHGEAMHSILPNEILSRRKKAEFSFVILQQIEALDRKSLWKDPVIVKLGIIDKETIMKHEKMYLDKKLKSYNLQRYWRMLNLEYWYHYNQYLDKSEGYINEHIVD